MEKELRFNNLTDSIGQKVKNAIHFKKKVLLVLVGHPLVGKDTFVEELKEKINIDFTHLSFDNLVNELGTGENYNEKWESLNLHLSKEELKDHPELKVKKIYNESVINHRKDRFVISNTTQLTTKSRRKILSPYNKHYKICIVFPILSDTEFNIRNDIRKSTGKDISLKVRNNLMKYYTEPTIEEGFNEIIKL